MLTLCVCGCRPAEVTEPEVITPVSSQIVPDDFVAHGPIPPAPEIPESRMLTQEEMDASIKSFTDALHAEVQEAKKTMELLPKETDRK